MQFNLVSTLYKRREYSLNEKDKKINDCSMNEELIDANGDIVPGPFNTVERTVVLEE